MILENTTGVINNQLLYNYFSSLVNCFFKILPIRENEEKSLVVYVESLQLELIGCGKIIDAIDNDAGFMSLISILQYLIDNPDCPVPKVKREVFKAINICNKIKEKYCNNGEAV